MIYVIVSTIFGFLFGDDCLPKLVLAGLFFMISLILVSETSTLEPEVVGRTSIVSTQNTSKIEGEFFLFGGTIEEKRYYAYWTRV